MEALLQVILPVFLVLGAGYAAARAGLFDDGMVDGVMRFAQTFAVPCLLFRGVARLDLAQAFDPALIAAFYLGVIASYGAGYLAARRIFGRSAVDALSIGFTAAFSNTLLLGLPITERAYGPEGLAGNYAIISIHAPLLYILGISLMELARARGTGLSPVAISGLIGKGLISQPLILGLSAGLAVNVTGLPLPGVAWSAIEMIAVAAIPAALFGLGGVLNRYRPEGDRATIAMVCAVSLILHPAVTFGLGHLLGLGTDAMRSAVITAAMAPGVNAYLYANLYDAARRVSASSVLFGTAGCLVTAWVWLQLLP
ncbi:MAG: AEC family transporter [Paracoccaceae bacterium]|nr:MAG: AEC family transporter [Paracoccaceae bacterium]